MLSLKTQPQSDDFIALGHLYLFSRGPSKRYAPNSSMGKICLPRGREPMVTIECSL